MRRERVLTGSKATRWNPSLRRPYWPSAARVTSCHCPDSFRYCSTQLRGGIMPEFASSGLSRYHHTPTSSTVTSKSQVSERSEERRVGKEWRSGATVDCEVEVTGGEKAVDSASL